MSLRHVRWPRSARGHKQEKCRWGITAAGGASSRTLGILSISGSDFSIERFDETIEAYVKRDLCCRKTSKLLDRNRIHNPPHDGSTVVSYARAPPDGNNIVGFEEDA